MVLYMKLDVTIHLDKKVIRTIIEEMYLAAMDKKDRRSLSAHKGWETRRKLHPELVKKGK